MRATFETFANVIDTIENGFPFWKVYALVDAEGDDYEYRATVSHTKESDIDPDQSASELRKIVKGLSEQDKVSFFKLVLSKYPTATGKDRQVIYFRYGNNNPAGKKGRQTEPVTRSIESLGSADLEALGFITREEMVKEMRFQAEQNRLDRYKEELERKAAELKEIETRFREADARFNSDAGKLGAGLYSMLGIISEKIPALGAVLQHTHLAPNNPLGAVEPIEVKPNPVDTDPVVKGLQNESLTDNDLMELYNEAKRQLLNRNKLKNGAEPKFQEAETVAN